MYNQKRKTIIMISILVGAVLLISVGFAAFSSILKIESSATYTVDSDVFKIKFSKVSNNIVDGASNPVTPISGNGEGAIIINDGTPKISDLHANFTAPGQSVVYEFYAVNETPYDAYLTLINYLNIANGATTKECVPTNGATPDLVNKACEGITVTVEVGGVTATKTTTVENHKLTKGTSEKVRVIIEYTGQAIDGSMEITFGDISLIYSTADEISEDININIPKVCKLTNDANGNKQVDLGDEVTCGNEGFYVIPNDSTAHPTATDGNVTLLAKYNLDVGNDAPGLTPGIQNELATNDPRDNSTCNYTEEELNDFMMSSGGDYIAAYKAGYGCNGTVVFAENGWWTLDDSGAFVYSNQSPLYSFVDNYKIYLSGLGVNIKEASLGSSTQLSQVLTLISEQGLYLNLNLTNFWLGTVEDGPWVYIIDNGNLNSFYHYVGFEYGVRPVIIISASDIAV